jgi:hypothetical protein
MTPEQKIIAIAEFEKFPIEEYRMEEGDINTVALPPYLTSRDAICGAVAKLGEKQGADFVCNLAKVHGWKLTFSESVFSFITSTPTQLADALLLTLGYEI